MTGEAGIRGAARVSRLGDERRVGADGGIAGRDRVALRVGCLRLHALLLFDREPDDVGGDEFSGIHSVAEGEARAGPPTQPRLLCAEHVGVNAGRMAVQIARRLGAAHIAAAGRDPERLAALPGLGADDVIALGGEADTVRDALAEVGRDVDVVLDYLWGEPTAAALRAIVPARADDSRPLTWIEIGSVTGPESPIPSAALRATNLRIVGSGQGSVAPRDILEELPGLAAEISRGGYDIAARAVPLSEVTAAWFDAATTTERLVIVPD